MINVIPFLIHFAILLYLISKSKIKICLSNFIFTIHTFSMLSFSIVAIFFDDSYHFSWEAYLIMLLTLLILLIPLRKYEYKVSKYNIEGFTILPTFGFKLVSSFLILLGIYSCLFFIKNISSVFLYGFSSIRADKVIFYDSSLFSKIAILGAFSSSISIFLFFYNVVKEGVMNLRSKLLLLTSLSFIFYTLNVAGRDGFVIWLFSFLASFCLFYPFLTVDHIKKVKKYIIVFFIISIPIFSSITIDRFGNNQIGAIGSVFSYMGQSLENLSYNIEFSNKTGMRSGDGDFPLEIMRLLFSPDGKNINRMDRILELFDQGFRSNSFASYINAFYPSYPIYVLFLFILICFSIYSMYKFNNKNIITSRILIVYSWYMIIIVGVFYFYYSSIAGNIYLILPFIFSFLLKTSNK